MKFETGDSFAHRLDPRAKLGFQAAFAVAAFAHTTPTGLVALTGVAAVASLAGRTDPRRVLWDVRFAFPVLVAAPFVQGATIGAPWFSVTAATPTALASYRVLLVLVVSAVYVRTTTTQASRAAIQWLVPGRPGQFLGLGVANVVRLLSSLRGDLARSQDAVAARLGTTRSATARARILGIRGLATALRRADVLGDALRARCLSWNPTLPDLEFGGRDWATVAVSLALVATTVG